jgi:predicted tellurium resistance membrane protein TerC
MDYLIALAMDPVAWVALVTLIAMEVVLGIDNLIFIAILTNKLPEAHRDTARRVGISMALVLRLTLLGTIAVIVGMTAPILTVLGQSFSWRDLILICGGLFLVWKATKEIHHRVDPDAEGDMFEPGRSGIGFTAAVVQILLLDLVFSIDSIITAVGMTQHVPIMVVAVVIAVLLMLAAATPLANFVNNNPTIVMLALGFLLMIGMVLIADGFGVHLPKGYVYAAMAFSAFVEGLNMLARRARRRERQDGATVAQDKHVA